MFIGHIPAAYVLTKKLLAKQSYHPHLIVLACLAGVMPDMDLFYFYWIDNRQHPHHSYWTHMPIFWLIVYGALYWGIRLAKYPYALPAVKLMAACTLLHLLLDSIVGKIAWFYPVTTTEYHLFHVPSIYSWWVANYLLHWTFLFELGLCLWATVLWRQSHKNLP